MHKVKKVQSESKKEEPRRETVRAGGRVRREDYRNPRDNCCSDLNHAGLRKKKIGERDSLAEVSRYNLEKGQGPTAGQKNSIQPKKCLSERVIAGGVGVSASYNSTQVWKGSAAAWRANF